MSWTTGFTWLAGLKPSLASATDGDDPADMGTAFGLDASFGHPDLDQSPAPAPAPAPVAAAAEMPWEYRLTRRTGL